MIYGSSPRVRPNHLTLANHSLSFPPRQRTHRAAYRGPRSPVNKDSSIFYPCRLLKRRRMTNDDVLSPFRWKWGSSKVRKCKPWCSEGGFRLSGCSIFDWSDGSGGGTHLLPGEYVLVEVKLDLLVGDVDAELLERVLLEVLETEDVQDADVQALVVFPAGERDEVLSQIPRDPRKT